MDKVSIMLKINFLLTLLLVSLLTACASTFDVSEKYSEYLGDNAKVSSDRTTIVFLVDGFSYSLFNEEFQAGRISNIKNFFTNPKQSHFKARTVFPSLTYPSISSLLTEKSIDHHGVYGNTIITSDDLIVNFEDPAHYPRLNSMIRDQNIFSRLKAKGLRTVSFDYAFESNSTTYLSTWDPKIGRAILENDYEYIDKKVINSLSYLLKEHNPSVWPDFIFVHLVGLDFVTHQHGRDSIEAKHYLNKLDKDLKPIFNQLRRAELLQEKKIVSIMTADHGFDKKTQKILSIEEHVYRRAPRTKIINEGRFVSLTFLSTLESDKKLSLLEDFRESKDIESIAYKQGNKVRVSYNDTIIEFHYSKATDCPKNSFRISLDDPKSKAYCPTELNGVLYKGLPPYLIADLSQYFYAKNHPDALIIAKSGVAFRQGVGQHGGPTSEEIFIPLLMKNAVIANPQALPTLSEILNFL